MKRPIEELWDELLKKSTGSLAGYLLTGKREAFVKYSPVMEHIGGETCKGKAGYRQFIQWCLELDAEKVISLGKGHSAVS
jgi:hypothetical protein